MNIGFKRAFRIKDFGNSIPGHGGFMDRFDCQIMMVVFVNAYVYTFIRNRTSSPNQLLNQMLTMGEEQQQDFMRLLKERFPNSF